MPGFSWLQGTGVASTVQGTGAVMKQYGQNTTAGSLLVAPIGHYGSAGDSLLVSDDQNGNWTKAVTIVSVLFHASIWYFNGSVGGVKPTLSVTPSDSALVSFGIDEYTGQINAGSPVRSTSTNTSAGTSVSCGTLADLAGDLIVAIGSQGTSSSTWTAGTGFQLAYMNANGLSAEGMGEEYLLSSAGSTTPTLTQTGAYAYAAVAVAFKPGIVDPLAWLSRSTTTIFLPESVSLARPFQAGAFTTTKAETMAWRPRPTVIVPEPEPVLPRSNWNPAWSPPGGIPAQAYAWMRTGPAPGSIPVDVPPVYGIPGWFPAPPITPIKPPITAGGKRNFIPRDPRVDVRSRQHADAVQAMLNSLSQQGYIVATGVQQFALVSGAIVQNRAPGILDDVNAGNQVGMAWIDTATNGIYFCVSNTAGAAVWRGPL